MEALQEAAAMTIDAILAEIRSASSVTELRDATAKAVSALTTEKQLSIRLDELESKIKSMEDTA